MMKTARSFIALLLVFAAVVAYQAFNRERLSRELYEAVRLGDTETVRELLSKGASSAQRRGRPPLLYSALAAQDEETALALIRSRAIGVTDEYLCTAARSRTPAVLNELIRRGADVNQWCGGFTPLMLASAGGTAEEVKLLLNAGADHAAKARGHDFEGETALYRAILVRNTPVVRLLLERGADPNT